jgi:hypothetical protein
LAPERIRTRPRGSASRWRSRRWRHFRYGRGCAPGWGQFNWLD